MTSRADPGQGLEYLDGELAPDHRAAVERHLHACEPCRRFVDEIRAVVALLGAVGAEDRRE